MTRGAWWGTWSTPRPGRPTSGKQTRYPLYRRMGWPQGRFGRMKKISPPKRFDPFQPLASRYTDHAIPATKRIEYKIIQALWRGNHERKGPLKPLGKDRWIILKCILRIRRSQWPRGLRRSSAAARLLRLWVRIPPEAWIFICCSVVCCQVVSATSWSLVQRSPTDRSASLCVV